MHYFSKKMDTLTNESFPEKCKNVSEKNKPFRPWFTEGILTSKKQIFKLESLKARKPNIENIEKYKNYNNIYKKLVRKSKI